MKGYIIIEHDEPQGEILHAITDLDLYLEEWNECMETEYTTMDQFNAGETYRTMYEVNVPKLDVMEQVASKYITGMLLKLETEQFGYMGMVILDCLSKGLDLWEENKEAAIEHDQKRIEAERAQGIINLSQPPVAHLLRNELPQLRKAINEFLNGLTKPNEQ